MADVPTPKSPASRVVCDEVAPLFERHLAGTLNAADGAVLSAHALTCERCATAMKRVADLVPTYAPPVQPEVRRGWRQRHPVVVSVIALAVIAIAVWALWRTADRPTMRQMVLRGRGGDLPLTGVWQADGTLHLTWARVPKATAYQVRLAGSSGIELAKSVAQPSLTLQAAEIATLGDVTVTVDAETSSGEHVVRSSALKTGQAPAQPAR